MEKENPKKGGVFSALENIKRSIGESRRGSVLYDLGVICIGFLLGGCHLLFGAYPLGIGFIASLRGRVWLATLGAALGAITLGREGIVFLMTAILVAFLRILISSGERRGATEAADSLFSEKLLLRMSSATIGGFVAALYEVLRSGFTLPAVAFGAVMIVLSPLAAFLLSGVFSAERGAAELIFGKGGGFLEKGGTGKRFFDNAFYKISLAVYLLLLSFALKRYSFFGIDPSFVFSAAVTLFAAKRFGAVWGGAAGFVSSVSVSAIGSAAFGISGAAAGALFSLGSWYGVIGAGGLLAAFGGYAAGLAGVLSYLPEYMIGAAFMLPLLRHIDREQAPPDGESFATVASDMVGALALSYKNEQLSQGDTLGDAVGAISAVISRAQGEGSRCAEDAEIFSEILTSSRKRRQKEGELDEELGERVQELMADMGLEYPAARAFGDRRKYIICAARDSDGDKISSPELLSKISDAAGVTLGSPEFYRRDSMAVFVTEAKASFRLTGASASQAARGGEENGDRAAIINTRDLYSYALLADGMGSGDTACKNASLAVDFLRSILGAEVDMDTVFYALNSVLRSGEEECSVAIDLFAFDRIRGEGVFIKSGAAPSYIKRGKSLFRIKSATMPLGVLRSVDAERTAAKIQAGDTVIMLSDGVLDGGEECPWLVELLSRESADNPGELSDKILSAAEEAGEGRDDMTALVIKIEKGK